MGLVVLQHVDASGPGIKPLSPALASRFLTTGSPGTSLCLSSWMNGYSVQSPSHVWLFATPWTAARQASLSITNSWSSPKLMSVESVMPSNHLILCHPLLLLPSIFPSIRVFSNESALRIRWPKYWSFSFNISPSNEHPGLISFRMDWLDLLAVQGTLKSLLQHHSSKASILRHSAFFTVQLSHPYMTTGKIIALTRRNFVDKVMSLLFNMLSRLVITFLPRSKHLLISWLQSQSIVILEPRKIKSATVSTVSPSICHEVMGLDAMILVVDFGMDIWWRVTLHEEAVNQGSKNHISDVYTAPFPTLWRPACLTRGVKKKSDSKISYFLLVSSFTFFFLRFIFFKLTS